MKEATFISNILTHYRVGFHTALRDQLLGRGFVYRLAYSEPQGAQASKKDVVTLDWAEQIPASLIGPKRAKLLWQSIWHFRKSDLLIVGQENKNLATYLSILCAPFWGCKVAYFGHGKNFQAKDPSSRAERWKRFWATKVHWWFAYTESCADLVESYGFPRGRITVFNNSIDLSTIYREIEDSSQERRQTLRDDLCEGSENVAVYVGGMYVEKRLDFLVEALDQIRADVPDFHAIFIGAGPDEGIITAAAKTRPWIHHVGPKFGQDKTDHALLAKVWLMPGLVGLAVLDSFAYETPMVTTDLDYHSPEFDYLEDGENGVIVKDSNNAKAYASAVTQVLTDADHRQKLIAGGRAARQKYSIEEMARRFADGIEEALK